MARHIVWSCSTVLFSVATPTKRKANSWHCETWLFFAYLSLRWFQPPPRKRATRDSGSEHSKSIAARSSSIRTTTWLQRWLTSISTWAARPLRLIALISLVWKRADWPASSFRSTSSPCTSRTAVLHAGRWTWSTPCIVPSSVIHEIWWLELQSPTFDALSGSGKSRRWWGSRVVTRSKTRCRRCVSFIVSAFVIWRWRGTTRTTGPMLVAVRRSTMAWVNSARMWYARWIVWECSSTYRTFLMRRWATRSTFRKHRWSRRIRQHGRWATFRGTFPMICWSGLRRMVAWSMLTSIRCSSTSTLWDRKATHAMHGWSLRRTRLMRSTRTTPNGGLMKVSNSRRRIRCHHCRFRSWSITSITSSK